MERERKGKAKRKLLGAFFALMMIFTAVSRIYDSFTVPKVLTSVTKRKGIETLVEGQGTVKVQEKAYYLPLPGLRIAQAALMPGSQVEEGQVLFKYDLASLKEQKEELERELKQLAFDIAKEEISQESVPGITQAELAFREWLLAGEELAQGQIKSAEAKEEYEREGQRLEQEYQDGMDQLEEELWQQQDADVEAARQNLESAKNSRNRELREAERKVEDLTEQLDRLSQEDEDAYREAERKLERAVEDLDDLKESWEEQIDSAKLQIEALESKEEWIRSGKMSAQESKRKAYEEQVKQQEEKLKAAKEAEEELEKAVEQAQWQLSAAQRQDETAAVSENQKKRIKPPHFFVFSDEIDWCREHAAEYGLADLPYPVTYGCTERTNLDNHCDMQLMSGCDVMILELNSVYSYMAALLNPKKNKTVINPNKGRGIF